MQQRTIFFRYTGIVIGLLIFIGAGSCAKGKKEPDGEKQSRKNDGLVLYETFDDNRNNWETGGQVLIEKGKLSVKPENAPALVARAVTIKDGKIKAAAKWKKGGDDAYFGICARIGANNKDYYYFFINNRSAYSFGCAKENVQNSLLTKESEYIIPGETNILELELTGCRVTGYINGEEIFTAFDDTFSEGNPGLAAQSNTEVEFDDLSLWDYQKADPHIRGVVYKEGKAVPGIELRVYWVFDIEQMNARFIEKIKTDTSGAYSLYLKPDEAANPGIRLLAERLA